MAQARIVITQSGVAGQPDKSRDDIVVGTPVTLSNADDAGVRSWRWRMISRPRYSVASLSSVVAANPTFTPDVPGSYFFELLVNDGREGERATTIAAIRNTPVTVGPDTFETRFIAAGESTEADWPVDLGAGSAPNTTGWWEDMDRWFRLIHAFASSGIASSPRHDVVPGEVVAGDAALSTPLTFAPLSLDSVILFLNGHEQRQGAGNDFTISGTTITWLAGSGTAVALDTSDTIEVFYES